MVDSYTAKKYLRLIFFSFDIANNCSNYYDDFQILYFKLTFFKSDFSGTYG